LAPLGGQWHELGELECGAASVDPAAQDGASTAVFEPVYGSGSLATAVCARAQSIDIYIIIAVASSKL